MKTQDTERVLAWLREHFADLAPPETGMRAMLEGLSEQQLRAVLEQVQRLPPDILARMTAAHLIITEGRRALLIARRFVEVFCATQQRGA